MGHGQIGGHRQRRDHLGQDRQPTPVGRLHAAMMRPTGRAAPRGMTSAACRVDHQAMAHATRRDPPAERRHVPSAARRTSPRSVSEAAHQCHTAPRTAPRDERAAARSDLRAPAGFEPATKDRRRFEDPRDTPPVQLPAEIGATSGPMSARCMRQRRFVSLVMSRMGDHHRQTGQSRRRPATFDTCSTKAIQLGRVVTGPSGSRRSRSCRRLWKKRFANRSRLRPVTLAAANIASRRRTFGSGVDSTERRAGSANGDFPRGFPATCRIAASSSRSHASVIRTGTTEIGRAHV